MILYYFRCQIFMRRALVLIASPVVSLTCTSGTLCNNAVVSRESQVLKQSSDFRLTIYDSTAQECDATKV